MKKSLLFVLVLATGCGLGGASKKLDAKVIGTWSDQNYTNSLFKVAIEFDDNWEIRKDKSSSFGEWSFDATYQSSVNQQFPMNLNVTITAINAFTESSEVEVLESSLDVVKMMYESNELVIEPMKKYSIAGSTYIGQRMMMLDAVDTSYTHQYVRSHDGNLLSFSITTNSQEDEEFAVDFIQSIKKGK